VTPHAANGIPWRWRAGMRHLSGARWEEWDTRPAGLAATPRNCGRFSSSSSLPRSATGSQIQETPPLSPSVSPTFSVRSSSPPWLHDPLTFPHRFVHIPPAIYRLHCAYHNKPPKSGNKWDRAMGPNFWLARWRKILPGSCCHVLIWS
jgi:hypothetical protein